MRAPGLGPYGLAYATGIHGCFEQPRNRQNAIEALSNITGVDLIKDVSAFLLGLHDLSARQLPQMTGDHGTVLRQAGGDGGNIGSSKEDQLA